MFTVTLNTDLFTINDSNFDNSPVNYLAIAHKLREIALEIEDNGIRIDKPVLVRDDKMLIGTYGFSDDTFISDELAEFYSDIIITGVEGGIGYWCQVDKWNKDNWDVDPHDIKTNIVGFEEDPGVDVRLPVSLNTNLVHQAYKNMQAFNSKQLGCHESNISRYMSARSELDAGEIDAYDASNIIQMGLFGTTIFG